MRTTPSESTLLSREAFKNWVFARSGGKCVFCGQHAVDPHHVLERKLFADGGYFLGNGAAVCEQHHWDCETTQLSVEQVRAAAGILVPTLPPGLDAQQTYDKWGNQVWPSGLRTWGPLEQDTGARKALAAGGFLGLLMPRGYAEQLTGESS
jgi:hypothetical protein